MRKAREHWGSRFGFVLAAAGSAIGLGALWQFPYLIGQHGGGLFVLAFILFTVVLGIPVFIAELILGRKAQKGVVGIFRSLAGPQSVWVCTGWLGFFSAFIILSYYSVVSGWGLNYILLSLTNLYQSKDPETIRSAFGELHRAGGMNLFWHFVFMCLVVCVVIQGVQKGIEKWSRLLTSGLFLILLALLIYSLTLSGFTDALSYLFVPKVEQFKASSVLEALGLAFFSLSVGQGIMLTYGSYMRKSEDIPRTVGIVAVMDIFVSLLIAVMIFAIIFTFGLTPGSGPGLIFESLPVLFSQLPGAILFSTAFFVLFVFTALTSSVAFMEVLAANLIDRFELSRRKAVLIAGGAVFIFGIPSALSGTDWLFPEWKQVFGMNFFETFSRLASSWLLPITGLSVALFTGWALPKDIAKDELLEGTIWRWCFPLWHFSIRYLVPVAILLIICDHSGLFSLDQIFFPFEP